jgi:hypothetical protein
LPGLVQSLGDLTKKIFTGPITWRMLSKAFSLEKA